MMTDKDTRHKLNNEGSAIVTVLIVIIFISILATTVLYLAGRNMKMKATDRYTKESFYQTEKTMEEIKAGLVRIASLSYDDAYKAVIAQYAGYNDSGRKNLAGRIPEQNLIQFQTQLMRRKTYIPTAETNDIVFIGIVICPSLGSVFI